MTHGILTVLLVSAVYVLLPLIAGVALVTWLIFHKRNK